ncbi:MAG: YhdP family protein [Pseudohongiellaceae bacterium]|nr:YhdP family protein [Pseudohongiellaceae bacterium]
MIATIFRKTLSSLIITAIAILLVLAIYVSAGRQLLPYVADYRDDIELRLGAALGQNVQVGAVEARLNRFNPTLTLDQVLIFTGTVDEPGPALAVDSLTVEVDAIGSVLQREWRLADITAAGANFRLIEQENGRWQLASFAQNSQGDMSPEQAFELISRFRNLALNDSSLSIQRLDGREETFDRIRLRAQNSGSQHFVHFDAWQDDVIGALSLSAELTGRSVDELSGTVYALLPDSNYSDLLAANYADGFALSHLLGSGEVWLQVQDSALQSAQGNVAVDALSFSTGDSGESATIEAASTRFRLERNAEQWQLLFSDFGFSWDSFDWPKSQVAIVFDPQMSVHAQASHLSLDIVTGLTSQLQLLNNDALAQLELLNPRGMLENLKLEVALPANDSFLSVELDTNLNAVAVSERKGSPAMWGINGYANLHFDGETQFLSGEVEVESNDFMIQLPNMFEDSWAYDYVNGRVKYVADLSDGQHIRLTSSVIVAESEVIKGRAQFATNFRKTQDEDNYSELELIVGVSEGDLAYTSQYLPTGRNVGPNTRAVMQWLDPAITEGKAVDSGLIYRGSVIAGAPALSRTLQMFYEVEDGTVRFDEQWPSLEQLNGTVLIADRDVDIKIDSGKSLDINFDATAATIRPNENGRGSTLTVTGRGQGAAPQGLAYLQATPVTRGFGRYLADWQSEGEVALNLALSVPLGVSGARPNVSLALDLQDSRIYMPEYELEFTQLNGELFYDSATGLMANGIDGSLFGQAINVDVQSTQPEGMASSTQVALRGLVDSQVLRQWPLQSSFVQEVLANAEGDLNYLARFKVEQALLAGEQVAQPSISLEIETDMQGLSLNYPEPFHKTLDELMPLQIRVDFLQEGQNIQARLENLVSLNIDLGEQGIEKGLVLLGAQQQGMSVRRLNRDEPGVDVLGRLPTFNLEEWIAALGSSSEGEASLAVDNFSNLRNTLNIVDVTLSEAEVFGQSVDELNVQVSDDSSAWLFALNSDSLSGAVSLPYQSGLPLKVDLDYLRLPAAEETTMTGEEESDIDPLADFDPSTLPRLLFSVDELTRGDADFGSWQFELNPMSDGAEFIDLIVSARGLHVGKEGEEARFVWQMIDGSHHSYLSAGMEAENLAPVLSAFGFAPSLNSESAQFNVNLEWPGSPAKFGVEHLSGDVDLRITEGRFLQDSPGAANGALKLISIINFDALVRRLRFSDDLLRRGLAYEEIYGAMTIDDGQVQILDRLQIIGPASLFQVAGMLDLEQQTIDGSLYITLPVSDNIPWLSGIAALNNLINWQVAVGVFLFDRIFGEQVDNLTSAQYALKGPWEGLEPELKQVFGADSDASDQNAPPQGTAEAVEAAN